MSFLDSLGCSIAQKKQEETRMLGKAKFPDIALGLEEGENVELKEVFQDKWSSPPDVQDMCLLHGKSIGIEGKVKKRGDLEKV